MKKKNLRLFVIVAGVMLFGLWLLPRSSLGITPMHQETSRNGQFSRPQGNLRVERVLVKAIGENSITSSEGRIIRFDRTTKIHKQLNEGSKMRTAELHYFDGRLVAIYLR
jgi:hypothetical protein